MLSLVVVVVEVVVVVVVVVVVAVVVSLVLLLLVLPFLSGGAGLREAAARQALLGRSSKATAPLEKRK